MSYNKTDAVKSGIFTDDIMKDLQSTFRSYNFYERSGIDWYDRFSRWGCIDPYNGFTNTKEYLFFIKPDLHICEPGTMTLNPELVNQPYFVELLARYPDIVRSLQFSTSTRQSSSANVFIPVLTNALKNNMDLPGISASTIDTASNIYGTSINYRKDGLGSDEKHTFSLEFEDTKYLEIYHFFKAYEEYHRLKSMGLITPPNTRNAAVSSSSGIAYTNYHAMRELHDQMAIYKFILDEDYETIIFVAAVYGVFPTSVPRDTFSDVKPDGGLRYTIQFEGQFVDDSNPMILQNFNRIIVENMQVPEKELPIYNSNLEMIEGSWARLPFVTMKRKDSYKAGVWLGPSTMQYDYKLRWRN